MKKFLLILIPLLLVAAGLYYWLLLRTPAPVVPEGEEIADDGTFNPFNRSGSNPVQQQPVATKAPSTGITQQPVINTDSKLLKLRHMSATPVGGFMASSTASTTITRYIDRGAGHIFQASSLASEIVKISNTTIPRVYESYWNKNLSTAILRYMKDEEGTVSNFYAEIRPVKVNASSTDSNTTPFEVKGKFLSPYIKEIAVSPKGDRIATFNVENGEGTIYISGFDESKRTEVIKVPLTQINLEWPEENTLAISTRASSVSSGYLYLVDIKKPVLRKVLGGTGFTAKVSPDAKKILYSSTGGRGYVMSLYNSKDNSSDETVFKTTSEKCVWSKLHPAYLYCAVPVELPVGKYPDDWYRGTASFVDQIWQLDTLTGEVHLIANLTNLSKDFIDVINPVLDPSEKFLLFMNKKDLTLWSLDLNE